MTTPDIVTTEVANKDAAASLAEDIDDVHDSTLADDRERLLGMTVAGYDPFLPVYDAAWEGVESLPLDDILPRATA